eukprot:g1929.t1
MYQNGRISRSSRSSGNRRVNSSSRRVVVPGGFRKASLLGRSSMSLVSEEEEDDVVDGGGGDGRPTKLSGGGRSRKDRDISPSTHRSRSYSFLSGDDKISVVFKIAALFMRLKDLFSASCVSKNWNQALNMEGGGIAAHMWKHPLPSSLRFNWWMCASGASALLKRRRDPSGKTRSATGTVIEGRVLTEKDEHVRVFGGSCSLSSEIDRDVRRTFPALPLMKSDAAQKLLGHVLYSVAHFNPDVGYCQGMNFVAAVMILTSLSSRLRRQSSPRTRSRLWHMSSFGKIASSSSSSSSSSIARLYDEDGLSNEIAVVGGVASSETLDHLYRMCEDEEGGHNGSNDGGELTCLITALVTQPKFNMLGVWRRNVPDLRLRVYQFDTLVEARLPELRRHLASGSMLTECYASQWFCTVFAYSLPIGALPRIWDLFLLEGWPALFRIGLAILEVDCDYIMTLGFLDLSQYFRRGACFRDAMAISSLRRRGLAIDACCAKVLRRAADIPVAPHALRRAEVSFRAECVRDAINKREKRRMQQRASDADARVHIGRMSKAASSGKSAVDIARASLDSAVVACMKRLDALEVTMQSDATALREKIERASIELRELKRMWQSRATVVRERRAECERWRRQLANAELKNKRKDDRTSEDILVHLTHGADDAVQAFSEAAVRCQHVKLECNEAQQKMDSLSKQLVHLLKQNQRMRDLCLENIYPQLMATNDGDG